MELSEFEEFVREKNYMRGNIAYSALGLAGETGEVTEPIKKFIRDGRVVNVQDMMLELGDVLHYTIQIAQHYGLTGSEIMSGNVSKITKRLAARGND